MNKIWRLFNVQKYTYYNSKILKYGEKSDVYFFKGEQIKYGLIFFRMVRPEKKEVGLLEDKL